VKTNHEETKKTKKEQKKPMPYRFFVVNFGKSRSCRSERRGKNNEKQSRRNEGNEE